MKSIAIIVYITCIVLNTMAQTVPPPNMPPNPVANRPFSQSSPASPPYGSTSTPTPTATAASIEEKPEETVVFSLPIVSRKKMIQENEDDPTYSTQGGDIVPVVYPAVSGAQQSKYGNLKLYANTIEYYITIAVGSPAQIFTLQIDTGSAITAFPSTGCQDCYHYNSQYNASVSSTSSVFSCQDTRCTSNTCNPDGTCAFKVSYGDSSFISGNLVNDVMGLPLSYTTVNNGPKGSGATVSGITQTLFSGTPITFGAITDQSAGFQTHGVDGIMGMAFGGSKLSCVPNCASLVMDSIVQRYNIPNVFSIALQPIQNNSIYNAVGGSLTIGGIDTGFLGGSTVYYTDVVSTPYYTVLLGDIMIGDTYLGATLEDFGSTIVDSGTTYTLVPPVIYNMIQNVMQKQYCHLPYVCGPTSIFTNSSCVNSSRIDISQFPDFTFYLSGVKVVMTPKQYLLEFDTSKGSVNCLSIVPGESGKTVLGDSFMMGYYIVFDRDNMRVGFANDQLVSQGPIINIPISKIALIAGAAGGGAAFVLIIIAVIVAVLLRRRSARAKKEDRGTVDIGVTVAGVN